ncbi:MAG TPA: cytochrome c oxidase subunit I, partial [Dehalococcoidia bacterium]|nr:cytochrome c oxidase subunit I [Dehalococcoidia bacterium]
GIIFFFLGGIEATLVRVQLAVPENNLIDADTYNQLFTMHALTMIFLALMPLSVAFFNYIIPLQIGARDVAFPRLNALSYWIYLFGGIILNLGWLIGQSPDSGWFAYANITTRPYNPSLGMDFYAVGLQILGISSMLGAFNFAVTIINMRAPGMSLMRMPVFTWMTLITSFLLFLAFPVITIGLVELMFDRFMGTNFFNVAKGGDPVLWQHLFWIFGHPEVYILILPAMGIVSDILPTFSRKPLFGYPVVVYSGLAIAFLSWGVWAHHMFATGLGAAGTTVFAIGTMLIGVPTGVKVFNWIATMVGGQLHFTTAMLYAVGFIALFTIGGISGVSHAAVPGDFQQTDTYYIVAHIHYVLFGGTIMGLLGGLWYWWPKITGRYLPEGIGKVHFWVTFVGMNLTFLPMHILGIDGMPRRNYTYPSGMGWDFWNMVETIGVFIIIVGMLLLVWAIIKGLREGEPAPADPWDGRTLEWTIPSPPPVYNFATIPHVHSRDPFWVEKYGSGHGDHGAPVRASAQQQQHTSVAHADDHDGGHGIHMPWPSYWPIITAAGVALSMGGLLFGPVIVHPITIVSAVGVFLIFIGVYGWCL